MSVPANRRSPRWRLSTVQAYNASRRKPGRPRTEFASSADNPFEIVRRDRGSQRCKFILREKNTGRVIRTFATAIAANKCLQDALDNEFKGE